MYACSFFYFILYFRKDSDNDIVYYTRIIPKRYKNYFLSALSLSAIAVASSLA